MIKKSLIIAALLSLVWFGGLLNKWIFSPNVGVLLLSNESSEHIHSAKISVCGQDYTFQEIPQGEYIAVRYDVTTDSHFNIKVLLQSGRIVENEIGYITNGVDFFDIIKIKNDELIHESRELNSHNKQKTT